MSAQKIRILGYGPDLPEDTPGIIVDSQYVLPTTRGVANGYGAAVNAGAGTTTIANGATALHPLTSTSTNYYCATDSKIYALTSTTMTDVSASGGYSGGGFQWTFATFGNVALAINPNTALQAQTNPPSGAFAAVSGAPKAQVVVVCGDPNASFAMCFNYTSGANTYHDGVFWSALGDYTDWTPSIATECGNIRLTDINGNFVAAVPYRGGVVAFKTNAMYLGTYVGGAAVWAWQRISADVGCIGPYAVCEADDVLWFVDASGLWTFDGSYPRRAPGYVGDYIAANLNTAAAMVFDRTNRRLWVPTIKSGHADFLVYNTRSGLWTRHGPLTDGTNYVAYMMDGTLGMSDSTTAAAVMSYSASGTLSSAPYFRLASFGSPFGMTTLSGVRPQFLAGPTDSTTGWLSGTLYYGPSLRNVAANNVAMTADAVAADARADRLDVLQTARFLSPQITVAKGTTFEVADVYVNADPAGDE